MENNKKLINTFLSVFLAILMILFTISLNSKVSFASNNLINLRQSSTGLWETDTPDSGHGYGQHTSPAFYLTYKGKEHIGYCIEASINYPYDGNYTKLVENQFKQSSKDFLRKIYYYTYRAQGANNIKTFLNQHAKQYLRDYLEYNRQQSGKIYYLNSIQGINTHQYHYIHYFVSEYLKTHEGTNNNESFISGKSLAGYATFENIINRMPKAPDSFEYHILQTDNRSRINSNGRTQLISFFSIKETPKRNFSIHKESANKTLTDILKAGYSIKGATYGVYKTKLNAISNTKRWQTLVTNANGDTQTIKLPEGEYWVKELTAPKGFLLDQSPHKVVLAGSNKVLRVTDKPKFDPIKLRILKKGDNNVALDNVKFKVNYYPLAKGGYSSTSIKTWYFKTDPKGYLILNNVASKYAGDDLFIVDGDVQYPIGKYEIIEVETKPGYILDSTPKIAYIRENGDSTKFILANNQSSTFINESTKIEVFKHGESNQLVTGSSMQFKVFKDGRDITGYFERTGNYAYSYRPDRQLDSSVIHLSTNPATGKSLLQALPRGIRVEIREVTPPNGYALATLGKTVTASNGSNNVTIKNDLTELLISKVDMSNNPITEDTMKFKVKDGDRDITSKFEKVSDYYVYRKNGGAGLRELETNSNGEVVLKGLTHNRSYNIVESTPPNRYELNDIAKTVRINNKSARITIQNKLTEIAIHKKQMGNGHFVTDSMRFIVKKGDVDITAKIAGSDGIYEFNNNNRGNAYLETKNGRAIIKGLIYGESYKIEEVKAPVGFFEDESPNDAKRSVRVAKKTADNNIVTVINEKIPSITTSAKNKDTNLKEMYPTENINLRDVVSLEDVMVGYTYRIKSTLKFKDGSDVINSKTGRPYVVEKTFIPRSENDTANMDFVLNGKDVRGKETVVFEEVFRSNKLRADHKDLNDAEQTTRVVDPRIETEYTTFEGEKTVYGTYVRRLKDRVTLHDVIVGLPISLDLEVQDKTHGVKLKSDGNVVSTTLNYTPKSKNESVDVLHEANLNMHKGKEIVAFEQLKYDGGLIASHEDINDSKQTIKVVAPSLPLTGSNITHNIFMLSLGLISVSFTSYVIYAKSYKNKKIY